MDTTTQPDAPPTVATPDLGTQADINLPYCLDIADKYAVIIATLAFGMSLYAFFRSRQTERSSVFMALRSEYAVILEKLQTDVPDHNNMKPLVAYTSLNQRARKVLRAYWVHSLNEFVITNIVHRRDSLKLWKPFFARAQSFALDMPFFRAALEELIYNENYSFGGQKKAYLDTLEKAYATHRGKPIHIPRNPSEQHQVISIQTDFESAATLNAQVLKDLKARLKKSDIPENFRSLIKRTEALLASDGSTSFQSQALTASLALEAAANGDFGVGAVIIDQKERVIAMAKNTVFTSQNTSCHAEMNIITGLQIDGKALADSHTELQGLTLISSLEPCPMCLARIAMTPIQTIIYLSPDPEGGMVTHKHHMPQVWQAFLRDKAFTQSGHDALGKLAKDIFDLTKSQDDKLGA